MTTPLIDVLAVSNATTEQAAAFLNGTGTDHVGRTVDDYLAFPDSEWEQCHNHVQWAFPSNEASAFNPWAPVVNFKDLDAQLTIDGHVNLNKLIIAFTTFLGFIEDHGKWSVCSGELIEEKFQWVTERNHNYLRLTRLLNLLSYFDENRALQFLSILLSIAAFDSSIDKTTIIFWSRAAIGDLSV